MKAYIDVVGFGGARIPVEGETTTIGRDEDNDVALPADARVSALHAVVRGYGTGWCIRDVGSSNGTFVNGRPVSGERQLRPADEITVGDTRLIFRVEGRTTRRTSSADPAPVVTPAEHRVLVELCRPLVSGHAFPQPASVPDIAKALNVGVETVKWHLKNLTRKFNVPEATSGKRIVLANEAVRRRAVSVADIRPGGA